MNQTKKRMVAIATLMIGVCVSFQALATELTLGFTLGNQEFAVDRSPNDLELESDLYVAGFELSGITSLPYGLRLAYGIERDLQLRTLGYAGLGYRDDRVFFSVTPTMGLLNSSGRPVSPGVRSSIGFFILDRAELEFSLMRPFLTGLSDPGDNNQSYDGVRGAIFFDGYLIGAEWSRSTYRERESLFLRLQRKQEYAVYTEIFQKNVPYRVTLRLGYQDRILEFEDTATEVRTGSLVFGPSILVQHRPGLSSTIGMSAAIFTLGREDLAGESIGEEFMYTMNVGLVLDLARLSRAR
ncbi:MAG: hypothetical protein EA428_08835 [Spirochaetaceae bacterium]|nr:MAG: hypothetical protein EA428_08835 [Spirochaetaceae bacterium]